MINDKRFINMWPIIVLLGIPITEYFGAGVIFGSLGSPSWIFSAYLEHPVYTAFCVVSLSAVFIYWRMHPSKESLGLTAIIAWIVCGLPVLMFVMFVNSSMPGSS